MTSVEEIQKDIEEIKARNKRVEADKAWETSWTRRGLILALTYIVVVVVFLSAKVEMPFVNAFVPALAFVLSTATVPVVKRWWMRRK